MRFTDASAIDGNVNLADHRGRVDLAELIDDFVNRFDRQRPQVRYALQRFWHHQLAVGADAGDSLAPGLIEADLEAAGLGEYHPVAKNGTPEGRQQNRRIEIILYPRVASLAQELPKAKEPATVDIKPSP